MNCTVEEHSIAFGKFLRHLRINSTTYTQKELERTLRNACRAVIPVGTFRTNENFPAAIIYIWEAGKRDSKMGAKVYLPIINKLDELLKAEGTLIEAFRSPKNIPSTFFSPKKHEDNSKNTERARAIDDWLIELPNMIPRDKFRATSRQSIVRSLAEFLVQNKIPMEPDNPYVQEFICQAFEFTACFDPQNWDLVEDGVLRNPRTPETQLKEPV